MQLDKEDTQRSNLNSKKLSVTLVLKYPDSFICFHCVQSAYWFFKNSCYEIRLAHDSVPSFRYQVARFQHKGNKKK